MSARTGRLQWHAMINKIEPCIVQIQTPDGSGTGFLFYYYGNIPGISTAYHVIQQADLWQKPIRIIYKDEEILLQYTERAVFTNGDAAVIWSFKSFEQHDLPTTPVSLLPKGTSLKVGVEVGWLGYPWGVENKPHFFSGRISAFLNNIYYIDGNAINGVSGGPVFGWIVGTSSQVQPGLYIIGAISAYIPNRATGDALPGLSVAIDVSKLHSLTPTVNNDKSDQKQSGTESPE